MIKQQYGLPNCSFMVVADTEGRAPTLFVPIQQLFVVEGVSPQFELGQTGLISECSNTENIDATQQYCWCDLEESMDRSLEPEALAPKTPGSSEMSPSLGSSTLEPVSPLSAGGAEHPKKKRLLLQERTQGKVPQILSSLQLVTNEEATLITARTKAAPRRNTNSQRRSRYIGVFKNGDKWQSLIAIDGIKTYIGTYKSQLEAAKAFDYYSILLNGLTAITNFDYCKRSIEELFAEQAS